MPARQGINDRFPIQVLGSIFNINDLLEAEKMDPFLRVLVPNVRVKLELRRPADFQEAALYAKRADTALARASGQDYCMKWHKSTENTG